MATYSFMDVTASLSGPTGEIDLGYGSASSKEKITVAMGGPKNTMTIGADGEVMHSLHADKSGTVTVNLLKTSPTNKKLSLAYNAQSQSSGTWGNNVIVIRNKVSGDIITARSVAFLAVTAEEQGLLGSDYYATHPVFPLAQTGEAARDVQQNKHQGKIGVLCLAPEEGLGVRDTEMRATHIAAINRFRDV